MPTDETIVVNPISETAQPVEPKDTPTPPPQPEAQAPTADSPAAESVEGSSQDPPQDDQPKADPPKPEKSAREQLIEKLTGVEEPKSEDEDEEPTPPAKPQDGESPKPEDTPKDKQPDEPLPEDLVELTNDTAKAMKPGEARRKINRLIKRVKDSEPLAAMSKEIIEVCEKNGLAPDDYRAWVSIGIGLQNGDPAAIARFSGIAEKVGIKAEAPAPALTPEVEAWLDAQVKDLEISATAAADLRKRLGAAPAKPAAAAPAPQAPAPRQPAPQAPAPQNPEMVARTRATNEIGKIADEYEAKIGAARFKELEPRIMAALAQRKGRSADAWPDIFRSVIEIELARAPKPAAIQSNLRPGGQAGSSTPQFKSERERAIHRLTSG